MWTKEWPLESGYYWFYGWRSRYSKQKGLPPTLRVLEVCYGPTYILNGVFMYPEEGAEGIFQSIPRPGLTTTKGMI